MSKHFCLLYLVQVRSILTAHFFHLYVPKRPRAFQIYRQQCVSVMIAFLELQTPLPTWYCGNHLIQMHSKQQMNTHPLQSKSSRFCFRFLNDQEWGLQFMVYFKGLFWNPFSINALFVLFSITSDSTINELQGHIKQDEKLLKRKVRFSLTATFARCSIDAESRFPERLFHCQSL